MNILLVAAVLPVILLLIYINRKDQNKEPKKVLSKLFWFGFLSAVPILIVELIVGKFFPSEGLESFFSIFINTFITVALIEEGFKWLVVKNFGYNLQEFDEVYDIIVYSVFASLGFACIENIIYVFGYGIGNAIMRAFLSIPGHACFGVLMGFYFSKAKINQISKNDKLYQKNMILSILIPALFHTMYDALIFYASAVESFFFLGLFFTFDIVMVVVCIITVKRTSKVQQNLTTKVESGAIQNKDGVLVYHPEEKVINFCPVCGRDVRGYNFCPSCGFPIKGKVQ